LYIVIPKGLFPVQDVGVIQGISVADNSVSYKAMAARQMALADAILKDADVVSLTSYIGIDGTNTTLNNGRFLINLKPNTRPFVESAPQIAKRCRTRWPTCLASSCTCSPSRNLTLDTTVSPNQYQFVLRGPSQQAFQQYVPELVERMKGIKSVTDVTSDLNNEGLSVNVEVNRQLAARYGITPATIDNALYDALGQRIVSTIFNQSNQYRVVLVAKPESLPNLQALGTLYLPTQTGSTGQVPLSGIADIKITKAPLVISHLAQFPGRHRVVQPGARCLAQRGGG
jgi:multidrug efflux pump